MHIQLESDIDQNQPARGGAAGAVARWLRDPDLYLSTVYLELYRQQRVYSGQLELQ